MLSSLLTFRNKNVKIELFQYSSEISLPGPKTVGGGGGGAIPPPKFWTGTIIDNELCFSLFIVIQNEKVFLFSVK